MSTEGIIEEDWFPETFSDPRRDFLAVLSDPFLVDKIAMIRVSNALCPHLRGDGKKAGATVISYGLPSSFSVTISHPHTRYLEELAGISPRKKTRSVKFTPPCETAISEAAKRIHAAHVANFTATAAIPFEALNL